MIKVLPYFHLAAVDRNGKMCYTYIKEKNISLFCFLREVPLPRMPLIEFNEVTKVYKMGEVDIRALNGVNFSVDEGEFAVVLGASGAGKSTILNILGGMDRATTGTVTVEGEDITRYTNKQLTMYRREKVGFVFQF